jgi:hypothetical protein
MTGCCLVPQRYCLRHCYHHLSAMQPLAQCLTSWLHWTRALFAILGRHRPPLEGFLGLDFGRPVDLYLTDFGILPLWHWQLQLTMNVCGYIVPHLQRYDCIYTMESLV